MAKRILLVDDEPLIVKGLKYTLEQEGFETDSAADRILEAFRNRFHDRLPQLRDCYHDVYESTDEYHRQSLLP